MKAETVTLFGTATDPDIQASKKRIERTGRKVIVEARPNHDTGLGLCGKHYCTCTELCQSVHFKVKS
jgi:hypothetical protein